MKWKTIFDGIPTKNQEIILDKPLSEYSEVTAIFGYAMSGTIACITDMATAGLLYIGGISIDANNTYTRCIAIRISENKKLTLEIFKQLAHIPNSPHESMIEGFGSLHLKLCIR